MLIFLKRKFEETVIIVFFGIMFSLFVVACEKANVMDEDAINAEVSKLKAKYDNISKECNISEAFLFFTDPHLLGGENEFSAKEKEMFQSYFNLPKAVYDNLPLSFCLSGGDWLNQRDTRDVAKDKLLFADNYMKSIFPQYHKMMGNHDTNYQGYISTKDHSRGDLPRDWVDEVYFSETGAAYFAFQGKSTTFYILDSDLDWNVEMDEYRWKQLTWLAEHLQYDGSQHIVLGIHMFYKSDRMIPMSEELVKICEAYNRRQVITMNSYDYDFSSVSGKIHYIISGHAHKDAIDYVGNQLPVIRTCNYTKDGAFTFDICINDYESGDLSMLRVGSGEDRVVKMVM